MKQLEQVKCIHDALLSLRMHAAVQKETQGSQRFHSLKLNLLSILQSYQPYRFFDRCTEIG